VGYNKYMNVSPDNQIVGAASCAGMGLYLVGEISSARFCFNQVTA
jgi:hypothetical protein